MNIWNFRCWLYELIETLWNVNDLKGFWDAFEETELIETLWNVN